MFFKFLREYIFKIKILKVYAEINVLSSPIKPFHNVYIFQYNIYMINIQKLSIKMFMEKPT